MPENNYKFRIGIDILGADTSSIDFLKAIQQFSKKIPEIQLVLFGLPQNKSFIQSSSVEYVSVQEEIFMDEDPLTAVRKKKKSSMIEGIHQLKEKKIDALISCGNTGALVTGSKTILPSLPSINKAALLAQIPTKENTLAVLDVGAGVYALKEHLIQFAKMGIAYQITRNVKKPKIGLLNIGTEAKKGTSEIKKAYEELKISTSADFTFIGNLEAKEVFENHVDILITDGFTGNVFLKTAEGIANFILNKIQSSMTKDHLEKIFYDLKHYLHYEKYPGAILVGIDGLIIKCHGYSTGDALISGIKGAIHLCEKNFISSFKNALKLLHF